MLPKSHRIPSPIIRTVLQSRQRVRNDVLECIFAPNKTTTSRFAVIVSLKRDKRAVKRNRMRRLIHESIHHLLPTIAGGWDCVVIVQKNIAGYRQIDMETAMRLFLNKAGLTIS